MCVGKLFFQRRNLSRISGLALLEIRYSSLQLFLAFLLPLAKLLLKPCRIADRVLLLYLAAQRIVFLRKLFDPRESLTQIDLRCAPTLFSDPS